MHCAIALKELWVLPALWEESKESFSIENLIVSYAWSLPSDQIGESVVYLSLIEAWKRVSVISDYLIKWNNFELLNQDVNINLNSKRGLTLEQILSEEESYELYWLVIQNATINAMNHNIII